MPPSGDKAAPKALKVVRPGLVHSQRKAFRNHQNGIGSAKPMDLQASRQKTAVGKIVRQLDIGPVNPGPEHLAIGGSCCLPGIDERGKLCRISGELPRQRLG